MVSEVIKREHTRELYESGKFTSGLREWQIRHILMVKFL